MQAGGMGAVLDACGVFFVPICEDLGFLRSELSLYLTFYFIATVFAMPLVGRWLTKYNINVVLSVAFACVCVAVGAMSFYTEPWQWWVSGVVFGLAGSFIFVVPTPILIGNWFYKHKGLALGVAMSFSGIGGAVLGPVFTAIIEALGWRTTYLIAAVIIVAMVLPWTLFVFKLHPEDIGWKPYGWSEEDAAAGGEYAPSRTQQLRGVSFSCAVKTPSFWCMFLFAGLIAFFAGFNSHLPGHVQSLGYSAMTASTILTAIMAGNIVEKLVMGWLNDKVGVEFTVNVQLVMVALGLIGLIFARDNLVLLYASAFLFGAQNSLVSVSTPLLIRSIFGERDYTRIYTYARIGTGVIGCLGPVTVAWIYDVSGSFALAFAVGVGICVLAFICERVACAKGKALKALWEGEPEITS